LNLILEVASTQPTTGASRHTFHEDGGSIGRETDNTWVLPHSKVSGLHAVITFRNAVFYIEDRSRNGVYINSSKNRLERGRPYAIKSGDRLLIDPYEIRASITQDQRDRQEPSGGASPRGRAPAARYDAPNPFDAEDPFSPSPIAASGIEAPGEESASQELDPLELLDLASKRPPPKRNAPKARDLDGGSLLEGHYRPPDLVPAPSFGSPADATSIPEDYDPLAPEDNYDLLKPEPARPPTPPPATPPEPRQAARPWAERAAAPAPPPPATAPPVERSIPADIPPPRYEPAPDVMSSDGAVDFGAVLAGAGLDPASITPEVARDFGQILRVVVSGVMDVMRSRQQIKDEFRMQGTRVRRVDNNPLKFSADVDDALHNLLVKRNRAYMSPVEAFEDAFSDLRNHQIAMLAGMRMAFESMLAEFDPDRLQEEFDRQMAKGLVPAKLRYWDAYRERQQQAAKDPEATFRRLFGEEFARAYEDQLKALKARQSPPGAGGPAAPKPPET
jgi:type VI secretion system FHA domain protein